VKILALIYRRLAVFALGAFSVWLIVFVFRFTDSRLPTILALSLAYALAAYVILPRIVSLCDCRGKGLRSGRGGRPRADSRCRNGVHGVVLQALISAVVRRRAYTRTERLRCARPLDSGRAAGEFFLIEAAEERIGREQLIAENQKSS
jgi:hypothetical protein